MDSISIKSESFKDVCSKILTAVDTSELSTITETLALNCSGGRFTLSVTNREYFVETFFDVEPGIVFEATVNAGLFLKLVSQITTDTIELSTKDNYLLINGNGTYKLPLIFDGKELLSLPRIDIHNKVAEFPIDSDILNSILQYNSKELTKGTITKPVQKLYYVDELGAITFVNGACVNSFTLPQPIKLLFNNRLVKLCKLFKDGSVKFTLGYDALGEDIIQTKVKFEGDNVTITAILSCDDTLLASVPVNAIRGRANSNYPYSINLNKNLLIQTINRLTLFNLSSNVNKPYGTLEFSNNGVTIYDSHKENSEVVPYENEIESMEEPYVAMLNLSELKTTLETCVEPYLCMSFGNHSAMVISRGNVKNVIPEVKLI